MFLLNYIKKYFVVPIFPSSSAQACFWYITYILDYSRGRWNVFEDARFWFCSNV